MQESLVFWKQTAVPVLSVTVLVFEEPEIFLLLSIFKLILSGKKVGPAVSEDQKKEKHLSGRTEHIPAAELPGKKMLEHRKVL